MLVIKNHRLETVLAHGVTSELWSAVRLGPGGFAQTVALKTLTPLHASSPPHVRAFLNEARAAAHVHHPHVVKTHEVIEEDGRYWLSMDSVRGWSLRALVATLRITRRALPLEIAVAIVRDAAAGLHAIHGAGLLHRHVTSDNLMASIQGHAVVLDFGCAAWQLAEQVRFTAPLAELDPGYASPQMQARQRVDARTDVYSLGAVLHELITGEPPPGGGRRQIFVSPSSWRPDLPPALEAILVRALEAEPGDRFASALDLAQALERVATQHRWAATPSHVAQYLADVFGGTDVVAPRSAPAPTRPPQRPLSTTPTAGLGLSASPPRHETRETDPFVRPAPPSPQRMAPPIPQRMAPPTPQRMAPPTPQRMAPPTPQRMAPPTPQRMAPPTPQRMAPPTPQRMAPPTPQRMAPPTPQRMAPQQPASPSRRPAPPQLRAAQPSRHAAPPPLRAAPPPLRAAQPVPHRVAPAMPQRPHAPPPTLAASRHPVPMPSRSMVPRPAAAPVPGTSRSAPPAMRMAASPDLASGSGARRMRPEDLRPEPPDPRHATQAGPTRVRIRR